MFNYDDALAAVKERYAREASTDKYATSQDMNLRELEINAISDHFVDGLKVLDVGCGNGYSTISLAKLYNCQFLGIDISEPMIEAAKTLAKDIELKGSVEFRVGNVLDLKMEPRSFDVIITERLLINIPTWEFQMKAIKTLHSLLKDNGMFLMIEATVQGLNRLNAVRQKVGLEPIPHSSKQNWWINRFDEKKIEEFLDEFFYIDNIQRFGMYFFISRVLHPLLIYPEKPKFESKINKIACDVALKLGADYKKLGHSIFLVLRKK